MSFIEECPECHDVSIIERSGIKYCVNCGAGKPKPRIAPGPPAVNTSPPLPTLPAPSLPREAALAKLASILTDFRELAAEFKIEVPQRVLEILDVFEDVIKAQYEDE